MRNGTCGLLGADLERLLPPVRRMLKDGQVLLHERPIDQEWAYNGICPSVRGWSPWSGRVFIAARSATKDWLRHPERDLRSLNEGDLLIPEVLFAVHDYLHVWATRMLQTLAPDRRFGYGPITRENAEGLTFLILLTEAAAVAGVDYWFLSTFDLDTRLEVGTSFTNLAVSYREERLAEYRRGYPDLRVQDPAFFHWLCRLYCTGVAEGFRRDSLKRSPSTFAWLQQELRYGAAQRKYARGWLRHLAGQDLSRGPSDLAAPVDCSAPWQRALIEQLGEALWRMTRDDGAAPTPPPPDATTWASPEGRAFDPRFDNLAALENPQRELRDRGIVPGAFAYLFAQALSSLDFAASADALLPCLDAVRASRSPQLLLELLRHYPRVQEGDAGPRDLFFYA